MNRLGLLALTVACAIAGQGSAEPPFSYGANLLKNASAEAPQPGQQVTGWSGPNPGFETADYGQVGGEWDWGLSGCAGCGKRYFRLAFEGEAGQQQLASQTVDLTAAAAEIDSGRAKARLAGHLGGYRDSDTTTWLEAVFEDASGRTLSALQTPKIDTTGLTAAERGSTSLTAVEAQASVPPGARRAEIRLIAKAAGASGSYLGLADALSFSLTK